MFHLRTSKSLCSLSSCCFTQDIPSHFSPYVTPNIHHFLHCYVKTWQDRQMSVLCELMRRVLCLLLRYDKTVRHQLKGYTANQPRTWLRAATTAKQGWWWGLVLEALDENHVCVCVICHQNRCLCCLSFWCSPTSNHFAWWLVTIIWHIPTNCFVAGGEAHILLQAVVVRWLVLGSFLAV